jgi:hypothetical protein
MRWEQLDESIKVRADFQGGAVSPVLFRRGDRRVRIQAVNTRWQDTRGRYRRCYFSVTSDSGDVYQLCFDTADLTWKLEYVMFEG